MIKNILAVATFTVLTACSSGSSDSTNDTGSVNQPGSGLPPATDTKAGAYVGDFGFGDGVYVINNDNQLSGLAVAADGSANSLFGDLGNGDTFSGDLVSYYHNSSNPASAGVFGAVADSNEIMTFNLNILPGQTIESLSGNPVSLVGAGNGQLTPATAASLAGSWSGEHQYCGATPDTCNVLRTEITFSGTAVSGQTSIFDADGNLLYNAVPIQGSITEFGDVSLVGFTWNSITYEGLVFFNPTSAGGLVFVGEATVINEDTTRTIASLLSR